VLRGNPHFALEPYMNMPPQSDGGFDSRLASRLMDVLFRAGLILAVTLYPLHQSFARRIGGRWPATNCMPFGQVRTTTCPPW
jgi:hypothetical protein